MSLQFRGQRCQGAFLLGLVVRARDAVGIVAVVVLEQVLVDLLGQLRRDFDIAGGRLEHLAGEVGLVGHLGAGRQGVADIFLQRSDELLEAFARHHGQHVDVMDDGRMIHPVAELIDRQAQATTDLLSARHLVVVVGMLQEADHEDVGVVPAFAQGRVREDETYRLFEFEKLLLLSQNQVIGIHIVGQAFVFASLGNARVDVALGLLVNGKVPAVRFFRRNALQVLDVRRFIQVQHLVQVLAVFLFKDPRVIAFLVRRRVVAVLDHFIDEEQGQDLDALLEQRLLLVEVRLDRLPNLDATQRRFVHVPGGFANKKLNAVGEAQGVGIGVDVRDHIATVLIQLVGKTVGEEVVTLGKLAHHALDLAAFQLLLELNTGHRRLARNLDGLQVEIGIGSRQPLH